MNEKPVCIIPARGGSKRIPKKNIKLMNGKPLIAWSIETALQSDIFSRVIVSTDNEDISSVAQEYGANVPFMRDSELADDFATTADVMHDALNKLEKCSYACCMYATAPMIQITDLIAAYELLKQSKTDCVVSTTEFDFHPLRAFKQSPDGSIHFNWTEYELTRSQDLPNLVHDAGAFYFFSTDAFSKQKKMIMKNCLAYNIARSRALDIDNQEDFDLVERLQSELLEKGLSDK
ncbi:MAG: pseudaminic acid cytidylyltransferase [Pseudomonadota bacterium]